MAFLFVGGKKCVSFVDVRRAKDAEDLSRMRCVPVVAVHLLNVTVSHKRNKFP